MTLEQHPTDPDKLVFRAHSAALTPRPWTNLTDHELEQAFGEKIHQGWDAFRFAAHIQDLLREKNA